MTIQQRNEDHNKIIDETLTELLKILYGNLSMCDAYTERLAEALLL